MKEKFAMVAPDVQIEDGKGTILISSEEGETEGIYYTWPVFTPPHLDADCLCEGVHVSLSVHYIWYSVPQLTGLMFVQEWGSLDSLLVI